MKKIANIRLPLIFAIALIVGILLGYLFIRIEISLFYIIALVPFTAIISIIFLCFSKRKMLVLSIITIIFVAVGAVSSYTKIDNFNTKELINGDTYTISATVCEKGSYDGGEYITVKNISADGRKINGKMRVYLAYAYGDFCEVGYKVNFSAKITVNDTFPYGKLNYNALKNIKYRCNVNGGLSSSYRFSLFGSVNRAIRNTLYQNLDEATASVVYAMLTGNTDGIEEGTLTAFRYGGIAHIFAVSGLHIGIIYGLLSALCKRLKLNRFIGFAVCILPLFLYSGVCGFTVSSIRAFIMCTVSALARLAFSKYDSLNSLSVAVIFILLFNPLNLMSVGFQLSVCAIAGIVLLSKNLARPFKRVPKKIKSAVSVSLSAQAGTMPVLLAQFGYLSGAGILLNILIVPLLSTIFAFLFVFTLISLILPFAAPFVLPNAAAPLELIISFLTGAGFEKALIKGFGAGAFLPVYYLGLFALSDKFNLKFFERLIAVFCTIAFLCTYVSLKTVYPFKGYKVIVSAYYGGGEVLIKSNDGDILIITEKLKLSRIDGLLNKYYCSRLSAVIVLGGENCASVIDDIGLDCDGYVYGNYINIQPSENVTINYEREFSLNGIEFKFVDGYSIIADMGGVTVGIGAGNYSPFDNCDFAFTDGTDCGAKTLISFNERNCENCVYNHGDFVFKLK